MHLWERKWLTLKPLSATSFLFCEMMRVWLSAGWGRAHVPTPSPQSQQHLTGQWWGSPLQAPCLHHFQFPFSQLRNPVRVLTPWHMSVKISLPLSSFSLTVSKIFNSDIWRAVSSSLWPLESLRPTHVASAKCWGCIPGNFPWCT